MQHSVLWARSDLRALAGALLARASGTPLLAGLRTLSDFPIPQKHAARPISSEEIEAANEELRAGLDTFVDDYPAAAEPASSERPPTGREALPKAQANRLTHVDDMGRASMVDVSEKSVTVRTAVASAVVQLLSEHHRQPQPAAAGGTHPGHLMAQLAGIKAAKMTSMLIPLCHNLNLTKVGVDLQPNKQGDEVLVTATASARGQTGVEMEALTAATFSAISLLHSRNAIGPGLGRIRHIQLESKTGGRSGSYLRPLSPLPTASVELSYDAAAGGEFQAALSSGREGSAADQRSGKAHAPVRSRAAEATSPLLDLMSTTQDLAKDDARIQAITAVARLSMPVLTWNQLQDNVNKKGDVLAVSRLAGVIAADLTGQLVPGSAHASQEHLLVDVTVAPGASGRVDIAASAASHGVHSVGAEALTAAAVSALTVYDMCKASSKSTVIEELSLRDG